MSKIDEIQERIDALLNTHYPTNKDVARIMRDIVSELKRIDAEQAQIKAILPPSWNKGPQ